jgi:hypothetical protein
MGIAQCANFTRRPLREVLAIMPTSAVSYNSDRDTKESERTDFDGRTCAKSSVFGSESSLGNRRCDSPVARLLLVKSEAESSVARARSQSRAKVRNYSNRFSPPHFSLRDGRAPSPQHIRNSILLDSLDSTSNRPPRSFPHFHLRQTTLLLDSRDFGSNLIGDKGPSS